MNTDVNILNFLSRPVTIGHSIIALLVIIIGAGSVGGWWIFSDLSQSTNGSVYALPAVVAQTPPNLDCGVQIYSPVQNSCVSKATFDQEMRRLFDALGIETSIYELNTEKLSDH